jgi:uncharacterized membrane protein YkvA (DUF1232 family)
MSEIAAYVVSHSQKVTRRVFENLLRQLPLLKAEFTQINAPNYPHLIEQLEFLADLVEDYVEGADKDIPSIAASEAAFALIYTHRAIDLIPDFVQNLGHGDDSAVVRSVLVRHERALAEYAVRQGLDWSAITIKP